MSNFSKQLGKQAGIFGPGFDDTVNQRDQSLPEIQNLQAIIAKQKAKGFFSRMFDSSPDAKLLQQLYAAEANRRVMDKHNAGIPKLPEISPEDMAVIQKHKLTGHVPKPSGEQPWELPPDQLALMQKYKLI